MRTCSKKVHSRVGLSTTFQLSEKKTKKVIYANVTRTRLTTAIHQRSLLPIFFWGRGDVCIQASIHDVEQLGFYDERTVKPVLSGPPCSVVSGCPPNTGFDSVTIDFALPATNRGIERKENSGDFGVRTTRGKTNSQLAWQAGKELVTIPRYRICYNWKQYRTQASFSMYCKELISKLNASRGFVSKLRIQWGIWNSEIRNPEYNCT